MEFVSYLCGFLPLQKRFSIFVGEKQAFDIAFVAEASNMYISLEVE